MNVWSMEVFICKTFHELEKVSKNLFREIRPHVFNGSHAQQINLEALSHAPDETILDGRDVQLDFYF